MQNGHTGFLQCPSKFVRCFLVAHVSNSDKEFMLTSSGMQTAITDTLQVADQHLTSSVELVRAKI
jgi:hypothetical protein